LIPIPGVLISVLTFPGVIVHEAAHLLFCRLAGLAVFGVCYFRVGNPAGYVIHEPPATYRASFAVSMGPFLLNSVLCVAFCSAGLLPVWELKLQDPVAYFFLWLGLSIGMHAFPSAQDLKPLFAGAGPAIRSGSLLAIVGLPFIAVLWVGNLLRFFWADLLYGIGIGLALPAWLLERAI
jgi:hypothetical protein